ncbi:MAG: hypothetical protein WDM77_15225 [Steroidobacteraceae bacterium]
MSRPANYSGEMISAPTPMPSTPEQVAAVIAGLAARLPQARGSVGVAFPSVVRHGVIPQRRDIDHSCWARMALRWSVAP